MSSKKDNVYVIDPDEAVHDALTELLVATGAQVRCFRSAEEFLAADYVNGDSQGFILAEADLPGMGSLAFLRLLRTRDIDLPVVVLASTSNRDIAAQAKRAGALEVIFKPLVGNRLLQLLSNIGNQKTDQINEKGRSS